MISVLFCLAAGAGAGSGAEGVPPLVLRRPRFLGFSSSSAGAASSSSEPADARFLVLALGGETLAWAAFAARYALLPGA